MAYVGNKGTHTLGDTDQNNTDPNESALFLPGQYSRNGQTLHWDPNAPKISATSDGIAADGGVSNARLLKRYYAAVVACLQAIRTTLRWPTCKPWTAIPTWRPASAAGPTTSPTTATTRTPSSMPCR